MPLQFPIATKISGINAGEAGRADCHVVLNRYDEMGNPSYNKAEYRLNLGARKTTPIGRLLENSVPFSHSGSLRGGIA
jgi:hypothetical protein